MLRQRNATGASVFGREASVIWLITRFSFAGDGRRPGSCGGGV